MQTREDAKKWKKFKSFVEKIVNNGGKCMGCCHCPFHCCNNGYEVMCTDLGGHLEISWR